MSTDHITPHNADTSKWQPRSMFLDSINIHEKEGCRSRRDAPCNPLRVDDIAGATVPRAKVRANAPNFHDTQDIGGASPKRQHRKLRNKPDFLSDNRDIEGSQPTLGDRFYYTNRHVDPLEPRYAMPGGTEGQQPHHRPRFLHDGYQVNDIEGAQPRKKRQYKTRDPINVHDITGAQAGWRPFHRSAPHATSKAYNEDISDIVGVGWKTSRCTNQLDPSYRMNGLDIKDDPRFCRPREPMKPRDSVPMFSLQTRDIPGANSSDRPKSDLNGLKDEDRRQFRVTNQVQDIPGAQHDTLPRYLVTNRHCNPLKPNYTTLDGQPYLQAVYRGAGGFCGGSKDPAKAKLEMRQQAMEGARRSNSADVAALKEQVTRLKAELEASRRPPAPQPQTDGGGNDGASVRSARSNRSGRSARSGRSGGRLSAAGRSHVSTPLSRNEGGGSRRPSARSQRSRQSDIESVRNLPDMP